MPRCTAASTPRKKVAAPDDDPDVHPHRVHLSDFVGDAVDDGIVQAKTVFAPQNFSAHL
jgi:hypothetical protein